MTAIDSTNDPSTMHRVIQGFIYVHTFIEKTVNCLIFIVIKEKIAKCGG